mmetsp:Transcript_19560/g.35846  ORF Transcript_19560/g.35846 Transcript_19560/m.35846 type:complete len:359 (+) Transcript_19560:4620-5696(+)
MNRIFRRDEYEELSIEELSQMLENLEKDNDQLRQENQLFESYLQRNKIDDRVEDEEKEEEEKRPKKHPRKQQQQEKRLLTAEEKYEIATAELEALRKNIHDGEKQSEDLLVMLKAVLDEIDLTIGEIKREAHEFKRDIVQGSENSKTGKIVAERLIKYIEEKMRQKDALIGKLMVKNHQLKLHINKANQQIKQKDQMNDELKFIDFHQLQIENKKHVKDIDERNRKLLSLKMTTGKTVLRLTKLKEKLTYEMEEVERLQKSLKEGQVEVEQKKVELEIVQGEIRKGEAQQNILKQQENMYKEKNMPTVIDYITKKKVLKKLKKQDATLDRRIEIAQTAARHGLRVSVRSQQQPDGEAS